MSTTEDPGQVTQLLHAHRDGDQAALHHLLELVYPQLRKIAGRQLAGNSGQTLDTVGLVNEVYLKLVDDRDRNYANRAHFFAVTARAMRQVIIDYARKRTAKKRGSGEAALPLDEERVAVEREAENLIALNEALERLGQNDERLLRVVECRFFAGLTTDETAEALDMSNRTVERCWREAKDKLRKVLSR